MKRVLVFHGHTENSHVFARKFTDIREALKDDIEFVFLDAPHLLTPADPQGMPVFSTSDLFANTRNLDPKRPTALTPRAWYRQTYDAGDSVVAAQSLAYVRDILERDGPFQASKIIGIMGFSQGGTFATLVSGLLEFPNHTPHFKGINHPPLEFLVLFSCNKILNPGFAAPKNMKTPTLMVVGSNDTVVLPEHSYDLAGFFDKANVRIEVHNGGHFVPRKPEWRKFLVNYFKAWSTHPVHPSRESPLLTPFASSSTSIQPYVYFVTAGEAENRVIGPYVGITKKNLKKDRRQSWTEVLPKTVWEGGVDPEELAKNLLGIEEGEEELGEEEEDMEPVQFDPSWNVNAAQKVANVAPTANGASTPGKVHFFEEAPDPVTARSPSSTPPDSASAQLDTSTRLNKRFFGSNVERRLRACKNAGLPRRLSQDPHYILVRTIGGREILVHREELEAPEIDYGLEE